MKAPGALVAFVAPVALIFAAIVAAYRDFVPYWDAKGYFDCLVHATQTSFALDNYRCFGHTTIAYLLPLAFTQSVAPWNLAFTYAANALLGIASMAAFCELLRLLFPRRSASEYALATALYGLAPLFVAHAIFLNLDYGMTAFFVLFLYCLASRRFWPAAAAGIALVLSKETGAAVFFAAIVAYAATWRERLAEWRAHAPLLAVPLALAVYMAATQLTVPNPGSWITAYAQVSMLHDPLAAVSINPFDPGIRSLLADLFVLNFQWIYTLTLAAAGAVAVARMAASHRPPAARNGSVLFLSLLLIQLAYLVTRYRDYNNARYVLVALPVLVALFYGALLSVTTRAGSRRFVLGAAVSLVLASNFRTVDPVSKAVFGTFAFGSHDVLDMPSILGGPRLDALVYNLESLQFGGLFADMMRDVRPAPRAVFFMGNATYNFPPAVDADTYALTPNPARALPLAILPLDATTLSGTLREQIDAGGGRFFYMAFANADNRPLQRLLTEYAPIASARYERHGYSASLYTFSTTTLK